MHRWEVSSWEQLCVPMERVDLPLPTAIRLSGTARAPVAVDWSLSGETARVRVEGVYLCQAWHPHVRMCGYFLRSTCLVSQLFFVY